MNALRRTFAPSEKEIMILKPSANFTKCYL